MKDIVYISDKLEIRFSAFAKNLIAILEANGNQIKIIKDTKDIWCRDYMPVIGSLGNLVRFVYQPNYLQYKKYRDKITNVDTILTEAYSLGNNNDRRKWDYLKSNIKLDGGAIEVYRDQAIISDRVFRDNKIDEFELLVNIKRLLGLKKITVIPQHPKDFTGHVDGLVRFVDSDTVLINDLANEEPEEWVFGFKMALYNAGYNIEELPYRAYKNKGDDARGIYMNFLKLNDLIIMPTFTFDEEDNEAKKKLEHLFPGKKIETIYASDLAKEGGIVNCVTWNK